MKPRKLMSGERVFIFLMGVVSLVFWVLSLQMFLGDPSPSEQGAFPLFVTTVLLLMEMMMLREMRRCEGAFEKATSLLNKINTCVAFLLPGKIPLILLYMLVYALILPRLGFAVSTLAFLLSSMLTLNRHRMVRSLIVSVCVLVGIVVIFQYIFKVVLP